MHLYICASVHVYNIYIYINEYITDTMNMQTDYRPNRSIQTGSIYNSLIQYVQFVQTIFQCLYK